MKICPFMSKPIVYEAKEEGESYNNWILFEAECCHERCMAWQKNKNTPQGGFCKLLDGDI